MRRNKGVWFNVSQSFPQNQFSRYLVDISAALFSRHLTWSTQFWQRWHRVYICRQMRVQILSHGKITWPNHVNISHSFIPFKNKSAAGIENHTNWCRFIILSKSLIFLFFPTFFFLNQWLFSNVTVCISLFFTVRVKHYRWKVPISSKTREEKINFLSFNHHI